MPVDPQRAFKPVQLAVLTVSDSRTASTDASGDVLQARAEASGHVVLHRAICPDDVQRITAQLQAWVDDPAVDAVITTGGTGITGRDVTPEAVEAVCDKLIPGFGELFRWLSYRTVGTSTLASRALAGVAQGTYIFALPGSTGAVKDGWDGILVEQLDSRFRPCNLVDLMPRLREV